MWGGGLGKEREIGFCQRKETKVRGNYWGKGSSCIGEGNTGMGGGMFLVQKVRKKGLARVPTRGSKG